MLWNTLNDVRTATKCDYAPWLAVQHRFVRLLSGKWTRVLGPVAPNAVHVRGRVYHQKTS